MPGWRHPRRTSIVGDQARQVLCQMLSLGFMVRVSNSLTLGRRRFVVAEDSHKPNLRTPGHRLVLPPARDTSRSRQQTSVHPPPRAFGGAFAPERFLPLGTGVEPVTARFNVWCSTTELTSLGC